MITEVDESGQKTRGFVYSGASVLAVQLKAGTSESVTWEHTDASGASYRVTGSTGTVATAKSAELDPLRRNAGSHAPFGSSPPPRLAPEKTYPGFGAEGLGLCTLDGVDVACGLAFELLYRRGANFDPNVSGPDPGTIINIPGIGRIVWVPGDDSILIGSGSHQNPDGTYTAHVDVSGNAGGHFETIGGTESAHAGQQTVPNARNATPAQQTRFGDAYNEMLNRLKANGGNNPCAELFGGLDKALKALKESTFEFQDLGGPMLYFKGYPYSTYDYRRPDGGNKGKTIIINSRGRFMAQDGTIPYANEPNDRFFDGNLFGLDDVQTAAFILLHELGHRRGIYGNDDNDGIADKYGKAEEKNARNSQKILDACFND